MPNYDVLILCLGHNFFFQGSDWSVLVGFVWSLSSDHRQVSWPHPPSGEDSCRASPAGHSAPGKTQLSNTGILEIFMSDDKRLM